MSGRRPSDGRVTGQPGPAPAPLEGPVDDSGRPAGARSTREVAQADMLAKVLDDMFTIPGTNFGIGLDGLVGLIPGVGDSATTVLASTILVDAARRRVPISVLVRMAGNLLVDTALGWIPLVGDAADFAHRANRKNYRLLRQTIDRGHFSDDPYPTYVAKAAGVIVGIVLVMLASAVFALWAVITILVRVLG